MNMKEFLDEELKEANNKENMLKVSLIKAIKKKSELIEISPLILRIFEKIDGAAQRVMIADILTKDVTASIKVGAVTFQAIIK